jgi:hypothetical protein
MKRLALIALLSGPAFAETSNLVDLPPEDVLTDMADQDLLASLVTANVIGMNCPDFLISQGEWALLVGTADKVAAILTVDTATYDATYYGPAFALLDQPESCATEGPKIAPLIETLKAAGGDTVLLRPLDQ